MTHNDMELEIFGLKKKVRELEQNQQELLNMIHRIVGEVVQGDSTQAAIHWNRVKSEREHLGRDESAHRADAIMFILEKYL